MGENDINEISVRLARIETKLDFLAEQKKEERAEYDKHKALCGERIDDIETYIIGKKEGDRAQAESAVSKSALSSLSDVAKTIATVITVLIAMKILHF